MKWKKWLENWDMTSLRISAPFLEMEWNPSDPDKDAAWELYIELLTRITTQPLKDTHGDEKTALESIYSMFSLTRSIIKTHGRGCIEFTKIAIVVLNQIVRPFTAKWHRIVVNGGLEKKEICRQFRNELTNLQEILRNYTRMLAHMAGVEDISSIEKNINKKKKRGK